MEISNKDKKLLVYLLAVGIVALTYFFVARPCMDKQLKLAEENSNLQTQVNHYKDIYINKGNYENSIVEAQVEYSETLNKFFGGLNQENTLINIKGIEDATNTWISRISFQDSQIMIGDGEYGSVEESSTDESGAETSEDIIDVQGGLSGMKQDLNLEFSCSYPDFKRFIEYIQNYDQRLFISSINASYSVDANQVSGSMILSQYAILGTDIEYTEPDLSNIGLGVDNIFSTLKSVPQETEVTNSVETIENTDEENSDSPDSEATNSENASENENSAEEQNENTGTEEEVAPPPPSNKPKSGGVI